MNNWNGGPRPLSRKKTVRLLVAMTILAWATQTLLSQWGHGAVAQDEVDYADPTTAPVQDLPERFVPGTARFAAGATIELRSEATVIGDEVRLRQIARWTQQDEAVLAPVGNLVLARIGTRTPFRGISVNEIKETLQSAGVNIAAINFVGATSCTVNRSDVEYDERVALQQWIDAKQQPSAHAPTTARAQEQLADATPAAASEPVLAEEKAVRTLRDLLLTDLSQRLSLPLESLQVSFKHDDQRLLNLAEPMFRFEIEPMRGRALGDVSWLVLIIAGEGADVQKATISADARAWQTQLVTAKPLAMRQVIRDEDLIERRALVERLSDEPLLSRAEVIGQAAARPLSAGTVLTARSVEAQQLVKSGQYVTVTLQQGAVNLKTVAKAMESGSYGQTIRVKNEATRDVFQVILTGPQTATMNLSASSASDSARPNIANAGN